VKIVETDLYTKIVLTVIAACLLFSAFKSVLAPREATAEGPQPVYVEGGYITVEGNVNISSPSKEAFKEIMEDVDVVNVRVINPW